MQNGFFRFHPPRNILQRLTKPHYKLLCIEFTAVKNVGTVKPENGKYHYIRIIAKGCLSDSLILLRTFCSMPPFNFQGSIFNQRQICRESNQIFFNNNFFNMIYGQVLLNTYIVNVYTYKKRNFRYAHSHNHIKGQHYSFGSCQLQHCLNK